MRDFITLKILDKFMFLFNKLGVDYPVMRKILQVKLIMDERRVPTILANEKNNGDKNNFKKSLLIYCLIGIVFMLFILLPFSLFFKMNIILGMIIFMIMSIMISDYSSVLLDVKEKNILLSKPIEEKTITVAKMIHILIYLFSITLSISAPTLLVGSFKYGMVFGLIFFLQLIFISSFVIFSTSMLYYLILYFFDGEKLKDIINYFQIALTVVMLIVYQLVGRVFNIINLEVIFTQKWWSYLIPSVWFAAPFSVIIENQWINYYLVLSIIGVILPILMLIIYFKIVAPHFEKVLQKLNNNSGKTVKDALKGEKRNKKFADLFCYNKTENVFFRFTQKMISSERNIKLKLYPSLTFATIIPLIFIFNSVGQSGSFTDMYKTVVSGNYYLFLYFTVSMLANSVPLLSTSDRNKAAWIFSVLPVENKNTIYKGSLKGLIIKYIFPVYSFVSLIFIIIYGYRIIPDIIVIFINLLLLMIIIFHFSDKPLPFSQDFQYIKNNNIIIFFQSLFFCVLTAGIHWVLIKNGYSVILYGIVMLMILMIAWNKIFSKKEYSFKINEVEK